MAGGVRPNSGFRISPVDRLGRSISPLVVHAAEQIGRRAIQHAENMTIDPAVAASLLEEAAAAVSRAIERKRSEEHTSELQSQSNLVCRLLLEKKKKKKKKQK